MFSLPSSPSLSPTTVQLSSSTSLPSRTYVFRGDGHWGAKIYHSQPAHPSVIFDDTPSSFAGLSRASSSSSKSAHAYPDVEQAHPVYTIKSGKDGYRLYAGEGPSKDPAGGHNITESGCLLYFKADGFFYCCDSKYTETSGAHRTTSMYTAKGKGGDHWWWQMNRSFNDFDGNTYKLRSSCLGDQRCLSQNGEEVSSFHRAKFSWHWIGELTVKHPLSPEMLHLLLCTTFMKYKQDKKRSERGL